MLDELPETVTPPLDVERSLEAILMIADEPQTLISLATALSVPVAAVRQSIERLVDDYDGHSGSIRRGCEAAVVRPDSQASGIHGVRSSAVARITSEIAVICQGSQPSLHSQGCTPM